MKHFLFVALLMFFSSYSMELPCRQEPNLTVDIVAVSSPLIVGPLVWTGFIYLADLSLDNTVGRLCSGAAGGILTLGALGIGAAAGVQLATYCKNAKRN